MNEMLAAATTYAELGYAVFPCLSGEKRPLTEHGCRDATLDIDRVTEWWTTWPGANIAIATDGLIVIDVDGDSNPWLRDDPEKLLELAQAPIALTPNGGRHYVFRAAKGKRIRGSASRLADRVDIRADGNYIVVAPSVLAGGKAYRWVAALDLPVESLPEPPNWLQNQLDRLASGQSAAGMVRPDAKAPTITAGARNSSLASVAGWMRRYGFSARVMRSALHEFNVERCQPPLESQEVDEIVASVARYEPSEVGQRLAEGFLQGPTGMPGALTPLPVDALVQSYPQLRPPLIHGLLRQGETMNIISAPKIGKSWLATDLALAVCTGRTWLGSFATETGDVLLLDNELHCETSAHRIPKVAAARGIELSELSGRFFVQNLRGQLRDIFGLHEYFSELKSGSFRLIILDAFYRFMPVDKDENDNGTMANIYNYLDAYAQRLGCSFVLIHHTSKGNQSGKSLTDVGAGAGSQSRATDAHLVLRQHEMDDVVVLDAAVRSWPPVRSRCLRWDFPVWHSADELDPALLRPERPRRKPRFDSDMADTKHDAVEWTPQTFTEAFVTDAPKSRAVILAEAASNGLSQWKAERLLRNAEATDLVHRWDSGRNRQSAFALLPQPSLIPANS